MSVLEALRTRSCQYETRNALESAVLLIIPSLPSTNVALPTELPTKWLTRQCMRRAELPMTPSSTSKRQCFSSTEDADVHAYQRRIALH